MFEFFQLYRDSFLNAGETKAQVGLELISLYGVHKLSRHLLSDCSSDKIHVKSKIELDRSLVSRDFLRQQLRLSFQNMFFQRENVCVSFTLRFFRAVADAMLPPKLAGFYLLMLPRFTPSIKVQIKN